MPAAAPPLPLAPVASPPPAAARAALVRRGLWLGYVGLLYNFVEAVVSLVAGIAAGSVSLIGFGVDAAIEFTAAITALWRLHGDEHEHRRERIEVRALRIIGGTLVVLACYVGWEAVQALRGAEVPRASIPGIVLAAASMLAMPLLGRAKRRVALALNSGALVIEAKQTSICAWLSGILLVGLVLNALLGWWWADPVAALLMVPLIGYEGLNGLRGRNPCGDGCAADYH